MDFYDREKEIAFLRGERERSAKGARLTVVSGRRRVGKTQLVRRATEGGLTVYWLVTRRAETDQCADFLARAKEVLPISVYGTGLRFGELFRALVEESLRTPFTLVVDELQEFWKIAPGVFGEIQEHWDRHHAASKMNLVVCGSVNSLVNRIFFDEGQPLYGRATSRLRVEPFELPVLRRILADHNPAWTPDDLLALWTLTGGVARYVEELVDRGLATRDAMLDGVLDEHSFFLDEGRAVLAQEFGKDHGTYFSILAAIARGVTDRNGIEQVVGASVGGHLTKLERDYGIVARRQPFRETSANKSSRYRIADNFLDFWFRFVFRNEDLIALKRFDVLRDVLRRDYDAFSGHALEGWFREKFVEERRYTGLGPWWDRKGENEIDLVGEDAVAGRIDFWEVKRDPARIDLAKLRSKADAFFAKNPELRSLRPSFRALSLADLRT